MNKPDFLAYLDKFAHVAPSFRETIEKFVFTESELDKLALQIPTKWKLKKPGKAGS